MIRPIARKALLLALALSGCTMIKVPPADPGAAHTPQSVIEYGQEAEEVLGLLAYYSRMSAQPADALRAEYNEVNQAYARDKTELGRLKLALLYAVPGAPYRDDAKALALLEGVSARGPGAESPRRHLGALLTRQFQERQRLQTLADKARESAREAAREEVRDERKKLEAQLAEEKKRADELQQKMDALLNIERELRTRQPGRTGVK